MVVRAEERGPPMDDIKEGEREDGRWEVSAGNPSLRTSTSLKIMIALF